MNCLFTFVASPHPESHGRFAHKPLRTVAAASIAVCLGLGATQAETLDSVVVSASRAEQRSFDAPAALESVDRSLIESSGPQVNLSESLNRVPGLTILNRQNYAQDLQLSIRGFGSRASFGIRGIRLLIDGIPATTPDGQAQGSSVALTSTDRIEVLRGPLAQMYGNAAGGVIQAWTRDAPEKPEGGLQLHTGSWDMLRTVWQLGGKVGSVGVIADYSTFDTNGFRDNSETRRRQFNSKISFGPSEQTRVNLVVNHFDMPLAQDPLGLTAAQLAADPTQAGTNAVLNRVRKITRQTQVGTSLTHALDAERSVTARAYTGTRDNLQYQANNRWVGLDRGYHGVGLQYNAQNTWFGVPVKWVTGYEYDRSSERRQAGLASGGEKTNTTRDEDNIASNSDLFIQATALMSDQWSLTGGMRQSTVRFKSRDFFIAPGDPDGSGAVRYRATNPVLGVTWHASESLNVYANIGRGFETPTLAELAYRDNGTVLAEFNPNLAASTSRHFEVGSKWTLSPQSRVDLALFRVNTSDEIVVSRSSSGQTAFKNAPGTTRKGIELSARSALGRQWRAMASATAMQAKFAQSFCPNSGCLPSNQVFAGNRLPGIPQHFVFGELMWAQSGFAAPKAKPGQGLQVGVELINSGKLYANDINTASAAGYSALNLKASHGWDIGTGSLTAYARIDNATDRRYVGSVIVNQTANQFYEPAPGRNWTVGLRLSMPL
jgi:iron complex outermembrane recepter protein